jgi:hypothetical protein
VKVTIESAGGVASRVRLGRHELTFDQGGTAPGGQDRGPSPLDVMATAAGAAPRRERTAAAEVPVAVQRRVKTALQAWANHRASDQS